MKTFQATDLKFVVWFMGFGSSRKPGKQGLFKLNKIGKRTLQSQSSINKEYDLQYMDILTLILDSEAFFNLFLSSQLCSEQLQLTNDFQLSEVFPYIAKTFIFVFSLPLSLISGNSNKGVQVPKCREGVCAHTPYQRQNAEAKCPCVCDFCSKMYLFSLGNHLTVFFFPPPLTFSASACDIFLWLLCFSIVQLFSLGHAHCVITSHFMITFHCTDTLN